MATKSDSVTLKISQESQDSLLKFAKKILENHKSNSHELINKMDAIDIAYARYKASAQEGSDGVDRAAAAKGCDVFATDDDVTPPIVVSQVDSFVAYLADVFLSGYPLFPVVSTNATRKYAEQMETLIDDHALLGAYPRHLLLFLRDCTKYNYGVIEADWDIIDRFSTIADFEQENSRGLKKDDKYFTRVRRLSPRNVIRDTAVLPSEVAEHGDFAGYIERISSTQMERYFVKLSKKQQGFNFDKARKVGGVAASIAGAVGTNAFREDPQISNYVGSKGYMSNGSIDWDAYAEGDKPRKRGPYGQLYERVTIYARIVPFDHGITHAPQKNTPQIWRLVMINGEVLVSAHRIISAYDYLPILIGQPLEDGFGEQTQSIAEGEIPFQDAAAKLFNIRFSAARRAVSDRALYNSNVIKSSDVNSKAAAPKIPVNINPLNNISLDALYKQIPFDMRGTESALSDAHQIVQFSKELHGLNNARTGQFQKGNKSVQEWSDVQAGSENRLRLPALTLEYQVFMPLKSIIALNILQYGENAELVSQKTGDIVKINITELRGQALSFKIADGYTPKSKMASTEFLQAGIQMISNSPILQQAYGPSLPNMFAHLMSLGGVKGLEEYNPQAAPATPPGPSGNLSDAAIQPAAIPAPEVP